MVISTWVNQAITRDGSSQTWLLSEFTWGWLSAQFGAGGFFHHHTPAIVFTCPVVWDHFFSEIPFPAILFLPQVLADMHSFAYSFIQSLFTEYIQYGKPHVGHGGEQRRYRKTEKAVESLILKYSIILFWIPWENLCLGSLKS